MIKVTPAPSYWAPVPFYVPGNEDPVIAQMQFRWQPPEETILFAKKCQDGDFGELPIEKVLADNVLVGWRDFDEPFSVDALGKVIKSYGRAAQEIITVWMRENAGAKRKNS